MWWSREFRNQQLPVCIAEEAEFLAVLPVWFFRKERQDLSYGGFTELPAENFKTGSTETKN